MHTHQGENAGTQLQGALIFQQFSALVQAERKGRTVIGFFYKMGKHNIQRKNMEHKYFASGEQNH